MSIRQLTLAGAVALACAGAAAQTADTTPASGAAPRAPSSPAPNAASANAAVAADATLSLATVLRAARDNLDVRLATHGLSAARADLQAADHAPLPTLSGKAGSIDLQNGIGPGNPLTRKRIDKSIGLDWTWERGDKRELRTRAARHGVDAAAADVEDVRNDQALAALSAYFDLLGTQRKRDLVQELASSSQELARTAARRLQAGDLSSQDAARAQIEAQRAAADLTGSERDVRSAALALAQVAGLGVGPRVRLAEDWPSPPSSADWPARDPARIEQRPDVRAALERVRAAQAALEGAKALRTTDVTWGASVDHFPGTSTRQVELRVQVPLAWGYAYGGEIGRAQAQLEQARDTLEKTRRDALAELDRLQIEAQAAAERQARYTGEILPRARQVAEMAEFAYRKGAIPLTDLLDARRTLRSTLLDATDAQVDAAKAVGAWLLRTGDPRLAGGDEPRPARPLP
jgi:cobalt-zinc-cadmium efflux system outer membrane protein